MLTGPDGTSYLPDTRPLTLAREFLAARGYDERRPLRHWRGDFYSFEDCVYRKLVDEMLVAHVTTFLNGCNIFDARGEIKPLRVTSAVVREAIAQLRGICQIDAEHTSIWIGRPRFDPSHVIAFQDGLIDATNFKGDGTDLPFPPTPDWFSESVLPCRFGRHSGCPRWLKFLNESVGDEGLIAVLQEFAGYCLTGDTSLQKMLWLHGPAGAGKSTVTRVLKSVVGRRNTVAFSLWDLTRPFTLSSLMGKRLAVSADAHIGRDTDSIRVLAELKAITGEDDRSVDRKFREALNDIKLSVRFVVCVNQFPELPDTADALRRRSIIIPFERSFEGIADNRLGEALEAETAGIVAWAMLGLKRLRENGQQFTGSEKSEAMQVRFTGINVPVLSFIDECCVLGPDHWVHKTQIYAAYLKYAARNRLDQMGNDKFGEALMAAQPSIAPDRAPTERKNGKRVRPRLYMGIDLLDEYRPRAEEVNPIT